MSLKNSTAYASAFGSSSWLDDFRTADHWDDVSALATVAESAGSAEARADATQSALLAFTKASSLNGPYEANAAAMRSGSFTVSGDGEISISVNYTLTQDLDASGISDSAEGFSFAGLFLYHADDPEVAGDNDFMLNFLAGTGSFTDFRSGTLLASLLFEDGDSGSFDVIASGYSKAAAAVPEPSMFVVFGAGLAGLGFLRINLRRK